MATTPAIAAESSAELLERGIYAEETQGDLGAAMRIYEQILTASDGERPTIAAALFRLGMCQLKSGRRDDATATFQKLARRYGDQSPVVAKIPGDLEVSRRTLAVLGFKNLSGRPDSAWLSTALAEMLGTELAGLEGLRVVPAERVAQAKRDLSIGELDSLNEHTIARIKEHLAVDVVVLGSYVALEDVAAPLRLDVRLLDTARGEVVAALADTSTPSTLFDLVGRVGSRLRAKLGGAPTTAHDTTATARPSSLEAAKLYADGMTKLRGFDAIAAQILLDKAISLDTQYAAAYMGLSLCWRELGYDDRAAEAARKAVDLSGTLPREERLLAKARLAEASGDERGALDAYHTLFALAPDDVEYGLRLAQAQLALGRRDEALSVAEALETLPVAAAPDPRVLILKAEVIRRTPQLATALDLATRARTTALARQLPFVAARAAQIELTIRMRMGDWEGMEAAIAFCREIYTKAGDRLRLADLVGETAARAFGAWQLAEAESLVNEASKIYHEVGHRRGERVALQAQAMVYRRQGRLHLAKEKVQQFDDRGESFPGATAERVLDSEWWRAWIDFEAGDITRAERRYEKWWPQLKEPASYHETGLVPYVMILWHKGDPAGASSRAETALAAGRKAGVEKPNWLLETQVEVLVAQDDLIHAEALLNALGEFDPKSLSHSLASAVLLQEQGRFEAAEERANAHLAFSDKAGAGAESLRALTLLVRARLARGADVTASIGRLQALVGTSEHFPRRLEAAVELARVQAASGNTAEALYRLAAVATEAEAAGYRAIGFDARLAQAETEAAAAWTEGTAPRIQSLVDGAATSGFRRVARKAAALLSQHQ